MKTRLLPLTVFILLTIIVFNSFSADCVPLKLWELIIRSETIVHGKISDVSDSTFAVMPDEVISGNVDPDQPFTVIKGAEQKDTAAPDQMIRFRKYAKDEDLLLFLIRDTSSGYQKNIGCYFESELVFFSDSISFSPFRQDSSLYCANCHIYNYNLLIRAVKLMKRHYTYDENSGYQQTSEVSENEIKATGNVAIELVKQIKLSPKPQNVTVKKNSENSRLSNFGRIIAIICTVAIAGVVVYEMR